MANSRKSMFFCQNCGYESSKWMGQCPACHEWNTFVEEPAAASDKRSGGLKSSEGKRSDKVPKPLSEISLDQEHRIKTGIEELDRVLGGGIVKGSLVLIGGDPGIGKSTLLLQVCQRLAAEKMHVLYVSGEESMQQIKMRAVRLGKFTDDLKLFCETDLSDIESVIERTKPEFVVIDSIQTMYNENVSSSPGSVSQVRESTGVLLRIAKILHIPVFIVGHMTKEGNVAGPRVLEHMVDTVLYFEGEKNQSYRILRAAKNRFGSTNEIGVFEMRSSGLCEVKNPSEFMLEGRPKDSPGSVVACSIEGTRPVMIEIQALVCRTNFGFPRRTANGVDYNRVNLLMAVLEKRMHINLSQSDAYVNITGGVRMSEPAVDLGILMAIASSRTDAALPGDTVVFGEVGLSGEVRAVPMADLRIKEAERLGFGRVILPKGCLRSSGIKKGDFNIELKPVSNIAEAVGLLSR